MSKELETQGIRVFVYGTLKQGHGNNEALKGGEFLGRHKLPGAYKLIDMGWFPGLIVDPDTGATHGDVLGEVYRISSGTLSLLDSIEGHPNFYCRHKIQTPWKAAWVYLLPQAYSTQRPPVQETHGVQIWKPSVEEIKYVSEAA